VSEAVSYTLIRHAGCSRQRGEMRELGGDVEVAKFDPGCTCTAVETRDFLRKYVAVMVMRTFFGSMWSARATCTSCVANQNPTATVK
jgi:hypothetical protein